jgi:hypothetical protein
MATIASTITTSITQTPTSLDLWIKWKKNLTYRTRTEGLEEWELAVIREMVQSGEIRRSGQYWGDYTTLLEFLQRDFLMH